MLIALSHLGDLNSELKELEFAYLSSFVHYVVVLHCPISFSLSIVFLIACFGRLLVIFCVINLINYIDRGAIASNGVNGSRRTCSSTGACSSGSGIQ